MQEQRLQNQTYLFQYSQEQTVNMIQPKHLNVQEQMFITKVFKNLDAQGIRDSVEVFEKKRSMNHRSSCSQVDSVPVMNQMDLQNSLQQHLEMKN